MGEGETDRQAGSQRVRKSDTERENIREGETALSRQNLRLGDKINPQNASP